MNLTNWNRTRQKKNLFGLFFLLTIPSILLAQRTDLIILHNGDRITGEIKKMELGTLTYKTDDMGTLQLDWSKVQAIRSTNVFEIKYSNGLIDYASPDTTSITDKVAIVTQFAPDYIASDVEIMTIVSIIRIKQLFWKRFSGSYSFGLGLKKADKTSNFNLNATTRFRSRKIESELTFITNQSNTESGTKNINQSLNWSLYRIIKGDWYVGGTTSLETNSELGLDLRALIAADAGKNVVENNIQRLFLGAGLQVTREYTNDSLANNSLEAKASANYKIFRFRHPKIDVSVDPMIFPSLSDWGRFRAEINANASIEIFKDFFFGLNFYYKFDNRPAEGASNNDWGFNTTIGYTL